MGKKKGSVRKNRSTEAAVTVRAPQEVLSIKCLYIGRVLGRVATSMEQVLESSRRNDARGTRAAVDRAVARIEGMAQSFPMAKGELMPVLEDLKRVQKKFPKTKAVGNVVLGHAKRLGSLQSQADRTCGA
jgi:hypothetical protein